MWVNEDSYFRVGGVGKKAGQNRKRVINLAMEVGFEKFQRIVVLWVPDIVYTFIELTVKAAFKP